MDWGVVAPVSAVIVTAVLGALGIAREQSAIRQLERVTAVLKDTNDDFDGRPELRWLQGELASRVKQQYRAPRKRSELIYGWGLRFGGWGLLIWVYFVISSAFFQQVLTDRNGQPRLGATWALIISIFALGVLGSIVGAAILRKRERDRVHWLAKAGPEESLAPFL